MDSKFKNIKLEYNNENIELKYIGDNQYTYEFIKSLSKVKDSTDLLPLTIEQPSHLKTTFKIEGDLVKLNYQLNEDMKEFSNLKKQENYQKLHVLKNISKIIDNRNQGYTYILNPANIFYDSNNIPSVLYVGYVNLLLPFKQEESDLVFQYKCLVTYLFDDKYSFSGLYNGGLEILKKTTFLNEIYEASSIIEIQDILEAAFKKERDVYFSHNSIVNKSKYNILKFTSIIAIIAFAISLVFTVIAYFNILPFNKQMNEASYQYVSNNYGKVISTLKDENPNSLPQAQKYMLAYSYIKGEIMNEKSKNSAIAAISTKSDASYLLFWIYIGRANYEKASDIAKELNDLKLEYHASYRAIEIIKQDKNLSGAQKQELLSKYEEQLKKVEKKLFKKEVE